MPKKPSSPIYLLLIITILIWGLSWPINKIGLKYIYPIWFATFRLLIGTIALFILVGLTGKLKIPKRRDLPIIFVLGIFQMGLFLLLINIALLYVGAGRSAILAYTTPLWVMPIAIVFFHEQSTVLKWLGFILGMSGIIILFSPWSFDFSDYHALVGNCFLLSAALCTAIAILCARNMRWYSPPLELLPWQLLVGTIPVLLLALYIDPYPVIQWNSSLIICVLYTSIFATAFGYWGIIMISKELPSITVSLALLGVPASGLFFSALLLHEPITLSIVTAGLLIVGGLVCVMFGNNKKGSVARK